MSRELVQLVCRALSTSTAVALRALSPHVSGDAEWLAYSALRDPRACGRDTSAGWPSAMPT
jgi:hypothetical protein